MNAKKKIISLMILILMLTLMFPLSTVRSDPQASQTNLEKQALLCLTKVYNLDFNHYNITLGQTFTLPSAPNDSSVYQGVDYFLTSSDSNLVAHFDFKDTELYQFALRIINGSVFSAQQFSDMRAAATDFLTKYNTVSSVELTPLIRLLETLSQANTKTATLGNLTLQESSGTIFPNHFATTFTWRYATDDACVNLIFDNGVFYTFMDYPSFTIADSTETMNTPFQTAIPTSSQAPSPSPTPTPNPPSYLGTTQQNSHTGTGLSMENDYVIIIIGLSVVIAVCVSIILYPKHKPQDAKTTMFSFFA